MTALVKAIRPMAQRQGTIWMTVKPTRGDCILLRKGLNTSIRNPAAEAIHCFSLAAGCQPLRMKTMFLLIYSVLKTYENSARFSIKAASESWPDIQAHPGPKIFNTPQSTWQE
jgi:hypothetical protein